MPGTHPPDPTPERQEGSIFNVPFEFMTVYNPTQGRTVAMMTFEQVLQFLTVCQEQARGEEVDAEHMLHEMRQCFQIYKDRYEQ